MNPAMARLVCLVLVLHLASSLSCSCPELPTNASAYEALLIGDVIAAQAYGVFFWYQWYSSVLFDIFASIPYHPF